MRARMTVTVDPEMLEETKQILKESGVTLSGYINICLKALVRSQNRPMKEIWEGVVTDLIHEAVKP